MKPAAGDAARSIETVTWVLFGGGLLIFLGVMLLLAWSLRSRATSVRPRLWVLRDRRPTERRLTETRLVRRAEVPEMTA